MAALQGIVIDHRSIKNDKANLEVFWRVMGIGKDPYAEQHRVVSEEPKSGAKGSQDLHPELYV